MSGNVFKNQGISAVPQELLGITVENIFRQIGLRDVRYELIGNTNKPYLGDIDIAVDQKELIQKLGLSQETFWEELAMFLKNNEAVGEYKIHKGLDAAHLLVPLLDLNKKQLAAIDEKGRKKEGNIPGFIQVDIFIGEIDWMKNLMCGAPKESRYKANHTHKLLGALFATFQWQSPKEPTMHYKFTVNPRRGFKIVLREQLLENKRPKKLNEKVFSTEPDTLAKFLFDKSIKWKDMNSYEKLYNLMMSDKFRFKEQIPEILDEFLETLIRNKMEIPEEIKQR